MSLLFDTSILIELLRQNSRALQYIHDHKKEKLCISSICEAEIYVGIYREKEGKISLKKEIFQRLLEPFDVVSFNSEQAEIAGKIKADLTKEGTLIEDFDILIAASAIYSRATLVTNNPKHFRRISNLAIESVL